MKGHSCLSGLHGAGGRKKGINRADTTLGAQLGRLPDGEVNGLRQVFGEIKSLPRRGSARGQKRQHGRSLAGDRARRAACDRPAARAMTVAALVFGARPVRMRLCAGIRLGRTMVRVFNLVRATGLRALVGMIPGFVIPVPAVARPNAIRRRCREQTEQERQEEQTRFHDAKDRAKVMGRIAFGSMFCPGPPQALRIQHNHDGAQAREHGPGGRVSGAACFSKKMASARRGFDQKKRAANGRLRERRFVGAEGHRRAVQGMMPDRQRVHVVGQRMGGKGLVRAVEKRIVNHRRIKAAFTLKSFNYNYFSL